MGSSYSPVKDCSKKPHKCTFEECSASFSRPYRLELHLRKHKGEKPFMCDILGCSKAYTNSSHLKRHKVTSHDKDNNESKEIPCQIKGCGLVLSNKYSLQKHHRRAHEQASSFACSKCSEQFKKKKQLHQHMFEHSGEPCYHCTSCNTGFVKIANYKKHMKNHKVFTCDCGEKFDRWSKFVEHRRKTCRTEINHKCAICSKVFTTKYNLRQHSLSHVEESQVEVYRCTYLDCKRSYKYKKNLNFHIAYYHEKTGKEVTIKCTECDQCFKSEVNLRRHLANIHKQPKKAKKHRAQRKDKGKRNKCSAALLSGIELTRQQHLAILNGSENTSGTTEPASTSTSALYKYRIDMLQNLIPNESVDCFEKCTRRNSLSLKKDVDLDNKVDLTKRSEALQKDSETNNDATGFIRRTIPDYIEDSDFIILQKTEIVPVTPSRSHSFEDANSVLSSSVGETEGSISLNTETKSGDRTNEVDGNSQIFFNSQKSSLIKTDNLTEIKPSGLDHLEFTIVQNVTIQAEFLPNVSNNCSNSSVDNTAVILSTDYATNGFDYLKETNFVI